MGVISPCASSTAMLGKAVFDAYGESTPLSIHWLPDGTKKWSIPAQPARKVGVAKVRRLCAQSAAENLLYAVPYSRSRAPGHAAFEHRRW